MSWWCGRGVTLQCHGSREVILQCHRRRVTLKSVMVVEETFTNINDDIKLCPMNDLQTTKLCPKINLGTTKLWIIIALVSSSL